MLKITNEKKARIELFRESEEKRFTELLKNYSCCIGISRCFDSILNLHDAYIQADRALHFGKLTQEGAKDPSVVRKFYYRDFWPYHFIESASENLEAESMQHEGYAALLDYDRRCGTEYVKTVMTYIRCGENATHAAQELGIHRNTVRNSVQFAQQLCGVSFSNFKTRMAFLMSDDIETYQGLRNAKNES